jgi:uncharacterized protein YjiS (DUF1127 family)
MAHISCSSPTCSLSGAAVHGADSRRKDASGLARFVNLLEIWAERLRARRELAEMSDVMLKDIGLSRSDASQEWDKPFWRP